MKSKVEKSISKEQLLKAIDATYDDSNFLVCVGQETGKSFFEGLYCNRSCQHSKAELIQLITNSNYNEFFPIPGHDDCLAISEKHYVFIPNIDEAQEYPITTNADDFIHLVCEHNKHYDVYYRINRNDETITFALGTFRRTLPLICNTGWVWKLESTRLLCSDIDSFDKSFRDPFLRDRAIWLGRHALKIKSVFYNDLNEVNKE